MNATIIYTLLLALVLLFKAPYSRLKRRCYNSL